MLTVKEIGEIKNLLLKSKKPLFYFDDDTDGLASYLLFKRFIKRGKGVVVKSAPILGINWLRKIHEYNPDRLFILDKPEITQEFVDKAKKPIVWIDHHTPIKVNGVKYYNPRLHDINIYLPTSYLCYKVVNNYLWIAMIGILGDWYLPDFKNEFCKKYPDLLPSDITEPGDAIYKTKLGSLIKIYDFLLKGKTSDVNKSVKIFEDIEEPYEILEHKTPKTSYLYKRFEKVNLLYQKTLNKAIKHIKDEFLIFTYPSSKLSFTGDLSNELSYKFPNKFIIIGREKGEEIRLSLRCRKKPILNILKKSLEGIEGYGGGHDYACGSNIKKQDFNIFIKNLKENFKKK